MRTKFICLLTFLLIGSACGGSGGRRDQQQYETVSEGSANGVTEAIQGPGETLPPITGTNTDHTTAFAFDPNAPPSTSTTTTTMSQPGTIAGTLPPIAVPPRPVIPARPPVETETRPRPIPQQPPLDRPIRPQPQPPPKRTPEPPPPPPPEDTPPPPTDTQPPPTDTTETEPPPTDTSAEEPPPPRTNTDTSATSTQPPPG